MNIKKLINWNIYFILLILSILSIVAILPYVFSIQWDIISQIPIPLPIVILLTLIQNGVIFSIFIFLWLFLSKKIWFWLRHLESYLLNKKITLEMKSMFKKSIFLWLWIWFLIIIADILFKNLWIIIGNDLSIPIWQWFLASFYWWISEEILLRLFLMTLVIWILNKIFRSNNNWKIRHSIIWFAIIFTAILFWIWHLPAVSQITELTDWVIIRTIVLNAIWGFLFWYLYWKNWLESAMIAHFSADIVLHVFLPIIILMYPY